MAAKKVLAKVKWECVSIRPVDVKGEKVLLEEAILQPEDKAGSIRFSLSGTAIGKLKLGDICSVDVSTS